MEWFRKLIGAASKQELSDLCLDLTRPYWELQGPPTFVDLFSILRGWLPPGSMLYLEGGYPDSELLAFLESHAVPGQVHIALGTIWPRPRVFHLPAEPSTLDGLCRLMDHHAEPELAIHFHVYRGEQILLEWHDAFSQPLLLHGDMPEERVRQLAEAFGGTYTRVSGSRAARRHPPSSTP